MAYQHCGITWVYNKCTLLVEFYGFTAKSIPKDYQLSGY